ncbi:MAG: hypothetical protein MK066_03260 [Crocinitomicaceae bacterium]|nr:hypothetical protein [Crocinitomicaceae bacterium]
MMNILTQEGRVAILEKAEQTRLGWLAIIITSQSICGSIAICFICQNDSTINTILLSLVAAINMGSNALVVAQAPMKYVLLGFVATLLISIIGTIVSLALIP